MTGIPDHYAALGIDPTADQEVIAAAYRALAKKLHPDTGATTGTANPERFDQVQRAWEVLRTPESRHRYDLELLAATEQELADHLATKRRAVPFAGDPRPAASPPPNLGDIRPEPALRPGAAAAAAARRKPARKRPIAPFLVPLVLLLAIAAGAAWLFLPKSPAAPPLPEQATREPARGSAEKPRKEAAAKPAPAPGPTPADQADNPATVSETPPLFGSTASDSSMDAPVRQASANPVPDPAPAPDAAAAAGDGGSPAATPIFGSSLDTSPIAAPEARQAPAQDAEPPPPLPKPRPAGPAARQAAQQPAAVAPDQSQGGSQPGARGADSTYRLVIFERQPGQTPTAWSAGVVFDTQGSCTRFGVKAVLRRMANLDPSLGDTKIWYECQIASAQ